MARRNSVMAVTLPSQLCFLKLMKKGVLVHFPLIFMKKWGEKTRKSLYVTIDLIIFIAL
jgi:hypothetical protein